MSIGANIKKLRESKGMLQSEIAEIAGVTDKAVSTWENDVNIPRMGAIQKIADYFGIQKSEIIEETELINAIRQTSFGIHNGKETLYDLLSEENKKIIDANISFLLSGQENG